MDPVEKFLHEKYADNEPIKNCLIKLYQDYSGWGLKDGKFDQDFTDGKKEHFYSYLWEMLLAWHLKSAGLEIGSADEGPDFKIEYNGQIIWIEAICPSPEGLPAAWLKPPETGTIRIGRVPHEQMLLRWTAALKEKKEKLTGRMKVNADTGIQEFKPAI